MPLQPNPHVSDRENYHESDLLAVLQMVRHAGARGVARRDLYEALEDRERIDAFLDAAKRVDLVRIYDSGDERSPAVVLPTDILRSLPSARLYP